jgi:hypothetical protein
LANLRAFSERADVSQELAGRIEVALDELFADDARSRIWCWRLRRISPAAASFLYDTDDVAKMCHAQPALINDELAAEVSIGHR